MFDPPGSRNTFPVAINPAGRSRDGTLKQTGRFTAFCGPPTAPSPSSIPRDPETPNPLASTQRGRSRGNTPTQTMCITASCGAPDIPGALGGTAETGSVALARLTRDSLLESEKCQEPNEWPFAYDAVLPAVAFELIELNGHDINCWRLKNARWNVPW